jgi:hypothetical protein
MNSEEDKEGGGGGGGVVSHLPTTFQSLRACSYDPAYRDVSLTETNISVRSYGIFRPACRAKNYNVVL